jgi:hypothetical protein
MSFRRSSNRFTIGAAALLLSLAACGNGTDPFTPSSGSPPEPPVFEFPPVSGPAQVYDREIPHDFPAGAVSRFVLHEDDTFELQYVTRRWGFFAYPGTYARSDSEITFYFDGRSLAGPWQAIALLERAGTRLTVEFNIVMVLSDFEPGVHVLVPMD